MSLSSSNLHGVLSTRGPLSSEQVRRLKDDWGRSYEHKSRLRYTVLGPDEKFDLADLIRDCQERLKPNPTVEYRPAFRTPFPFNMGPNGSLIFLGLLVVGVAVIGGLILFTEGAFK